MATATGDLNNALRKMNNMARALRYSGELSIDGLREGVPAAYLPLLHYSLLEYSHRAAEAVYNMGTDLSGKSDAKFIEGVYKVLRDLFDYIPTLTKAQFMFRGFAERKALMVADVMALVRQRYPSKNKKTASSKRLKEEEPVKIDKVIVTPHRVKEFAGVPVLWAGSPRPLISKKPECIKDKQSNGLSPENQPVISQESRSSRVQITDENLSKIKTEVKRELLIELRSELNKPTTDNFTPRSEVPNVELLFQKVSTSLEHVIAQVDNLAARISIMESKISYMNQTPQPLSKPTTVVYSSPLAPHSTNTITPTKSSPLSNGILLSNSLLDKPRMKDNCILQSVVEENSIGTDADCSTLGPQISDSNIPFEMSNDATGTFPSSLPDRLVIDSEEDKTTPIPVEDLSSNSFALKDQSIDPLIMEQSKRLEAIYSNLRSCFEGIQTPRADVHQQE